ncbi:hypothetical protein PSTT_09488 [Puccinia striiformis]|uniref:Uncharacterized protein n=1 Tax=Puccinia striiformis TaxID=27350 RepID=A0A2S4V8A7_9BASI|nr:hypothetical protein PSTT_09488 [Puccinia striiformis]
MNNNVQTSDGPTVASALLDQKRQATINYLESRRTRTNNLNKSSNNNTQEPSCLGNENQRNTTAVGERNQLGEILGALGDTQGERQGGKSLDTQANTQPPSATSTHTSDQTFLLNAARSAMEKGNQKEAEGLLRSLAALFPEEVASRGEGNGVTPTTDMTASTKSKEDDGGKSDTRNSIKKIGAVSYMVGEVPDYTFAGLPSFYDKNVKAMKGLMPLTIFDPLWQRAAAANRTEKETIDRADTEERRYTGVTAPDEWSQSYAQWSRNYQSFIATLKDVYNFVIFSEWFRTHRDCCDLIMRREGFCAGFMYDLAGRHADETLAEARRNGEIGLMDNPYIHGGKKEHCDPHTGNEKTSYSRERGNDRGRSSNQSQLRATPSRYRDDHQGARGVREGYEQSYRNRRDDQNRRDNDRNRGGETGYEDRVKDRSKNYKPQNGYRYEPTRGRKRSEGRSVRIRNNEYQKTTPVWPTTIKCEMNIAVWMSALTKAGLSEKYADVIEGFQVGFDQGIPDHEIGDLRWYTPPNHESAKWAEEEIQSNFQKDREVKRDGG